MIFTVILFLLAGSILGWSLTERRLNMRHAYLLEAHNAAEAVAEYGASQIVSRFNSYAIPPSMNPAGSTPLVLPPSSFFAGSNVVTSAYSSSNPNGMELIGGSYVTIPSSGSLYYFDPNSPENENETLKGQYVYRRDIQVIARATVVPPFGAPITAYVTEKVSIRGAPLFSHAIFYSNNDLEAAPGPTLDVYGPVHVNGNMFPLAQGTVETGTANAVNFRGPVSITGNLYHAWASEKPAAQGRGYDSNSNTLDGEPLGNDPITFITAAGAQKNLKDSTGVWKDSTMGTDLTLLTSKGRYQDTSTPAITQLQGKLSNDFRQYAAQTWGGNLQTAAMGVQFYNPVAFTEPVSDSGDLPDPHAIIDPPDTTLSTSDPYYTAKSELELQKLSNQSGLYVQVEVTPGTAGAKDTAQITLYGAPGSWAASGSGNVSLKGPNGGIKLGSVPPDLINFIPYSAATTGTANTPATQNTYSVVKVGSKYRIKKTTKTNGNIVQSVTAVYNGSSTTPTTTPVGGTSFSGGTTSESTDSVQYNTQSAALAQKPADTIDIIGETTNELSDSSTVVQSGLYDQRQRAGINLVQIDMVALKAALTNAKSNTNGDGKAIVTSSGNIWGEGSNEWNGGLYVGIKSTSGSAYPGQTSMVVANGQVPSGSSLLPTVNDVSGLALVTNGPMYVLGHFNADGANATNAGSATTPDDGKTNAATMPVSAQVPVTLAADAITILSPNYFGGGAASTTNGSSTSAYKNYASDRLNASGSVEIASAFITGIVSTTNSGFSGGVHNLPRFIENWGSNAVAIRGSLVSLYASNVATGKWAQRYYSAPKRIWGFDKTFENGTFPPLTPQVMSYKRAEFNNLSSNDSIDRNGTTLSGYLSLRHVLWPKLY
jgi:hypothetical protein